jgi:hypothetical protein
VEIDFPFNHPCNDSPILLLFLWVETKYFIMQKEKIKKRNIVKEEGAINRV